MEPTVTTSTLSIRFALAVLAVCIMVFAVIARLASPSASAPDMAALSPVQLRALAQQATLRVSANACGRATLGSGVIIEGRLVTNAHVVEDAADVKADQPIDPVVVPVLAVDRRSDLAVAEQPAGVGLVLAGDVAVNAEAIVGQSVTLAGHADGDGGIEIQPGIVSGRVPGDAYGYAVDVLLIDAQTRGGYSGGPVLDNAGNVVAILSGFDRSTGLSLAIPADIVRDFLDVSSVEASGSAPIPSDCNVG